MDALLPIVILAAWQRRSFVVNGVANLLDVLVRVLFFSHYFYYFENSEFGTLRCVSTRVKFRGHIGGLCSLLGIYCRPSGLVSSVFTH